MPERPRSSNARTRIFSAAPGPHARLALTLTLAVLAVVVGPVPRAIPDAVALTPSIPLAAGSSPMGIAIDPISGRVYVTNSGRNTVSVIDSLTNTVITSVPVGAEPGQLTLNPKTHHLYVANFGDHSVSVIDTTTNKVVDILEVGGLGLALDPIAQRIYATGGTTLSIIDAATDTVITKLPAPSGTSLWGVVVDAAAERVYVSDIFAPRVLVFGAEGNLLSEIRIDDPGRFAMAIDPAHKRLYVASYVPSSARVFVIDTGVRAVVGKISVGGLPFGLAFDANKGLVYVSNLADGTLTTIDSLTRLALVTQPVGRKPAGLALSPTGRLYLVSFGDATVVTRP